MSRYYGEYEISLTDKNRVIIPAKLREILISNSEADVSIAYHNQGWLEIYDKHYLEQLTKEFKTISSLHTDLRDLQRLLYSQMQQQELDTQGRMILSQQMLTALQISNTTEKTKQLVVVGVGDYLEIWEAQRWEIKKKGLKSNLTNISERLAFILDKLHADWD